MKLSGKKDYILLLMLLTLKNKLLIRLFMKKRPLIKVKDNQKDLKDGIKTYFDLDLTSDLTDIIVVETDYKKEHGRIEKKNLLSIL